MAEGRSREAWQHTAHLLCLLANIHRDPKKSRPFRPRDFDPHQQQKAKVMATVGIDVLKQVFVR